MIIKSMGPLDVGRMQENDLLVVPLDRCDERGPPKGLASELRYFRSAL